MDPEAINKKREHFLDLKRSATYTRNWKARLALLIGFLVLFGLYVLALPPPNFKTGVITVPSGFSLREIASLLDRENVIRSSIYLRVIIIARGKARSVYAGKYAFDEPENLFAVASRLTSGREDGKAEKITIPEGTTVMQMAKILQRRLPFFDDVHFVAIASPREGYLFPDTYFFSHAVTAEEIKERMEANFEYRLLPIDTEIKAFGRPIEDIVIMASLLEGEAKTTDDRKIVAGILWKRLEIGMPLQVDAVFQYINGKASRELSNDDLKIDSPYNTYKFAGLPPTPISNPGLDSIIATIEPKQTKYLYYLSDSEGIIHYSETFEEHVRNKEKYLK